ncbi:PIG-L deacetylase family protein [Corynebacterium sp.]|uniref:PIG-L deacetylase family protein n=1 Tax=Corynebacterium sp. TaxID=1720 RepID=UPI0037351879
MPLVLSTLVLVISLVSLGMLSRQRFRRTFKRSLRKPEQHLWLLNTGFLIAAVCSVLHLITENGWLVVAAVLVLILTLAAFAVINLEFRIPERAPSRRTSILFVAAHPDDMEIACGSTIAKLVDTGHEVHGIIMSDGSDGGDASLRPDEAREGANFLGLSTLRIMHMTDRALNSHMNEMIAVIEESIVHHNPDIIFTHSKNEVHQDHLAVHQAVMQAGRNHHSILCFESPSVTTDFKPTVFIDVMDYSDVKAEAIAAHANQSGKPYMTREITDSITTFRGRQARVRRAEGFEPMRLNLNDPLPL